MTAVHDDRKLTNNKAIQISAATPMYPPIPVLIKLTAIVLLSFLQCYVCIH